MEPSDISGISELQEDSDEAEITRKDITASKIVDYPIEHIHTSNNLKESFQLDLNFIASLDNAFDEMNTNYCSILPMSIPVIPRIDDKVLNMDDD